MHLKASIMDFWAGTAVTATALALVRLMPRASSTALQCSMLWPEVLKG